MISTSYTAVVERNRVWSSSFETEPYETAWANEAIFFIRALDASGISDGASARIQISPDGMHWCDEGTLVSLPDQPQGLSFSRVTCFGGWLRLAGELPPGAQLKVIVYLALKAS